MDASYYLDKLTSVVPKESKTLFMDDLSNYIKEIKLDYDLDISCELRHNLGNDPDYEKFKEEVQYIIDKMETLMVETPMG